MTSALPLSDVIEGRPGELILQRSFRGQDLQAAGMKSGVDKL